MRWFSRQPLWLKLLITAGVCAVLVEGVLLRFYLQWLYRDYYWPDNYELGITWYATGILASGLALVAVTFWHVLARQHRD